MPVRLTRHECETSEINMTMKFYARMVIEGDRAGETALKKAALEFYDCYVIESRAYK